MYGMNKRRLHAPIDMINGKVLPQLLRFAVPMMPTGICSFCITRRISSSANAPAMPLPPRLPPSRALVIVIFLAACRICCRQLTKSTPAVVSCAHRKNFEFFVPLDFLCECVSIYRLIIIC